jgi:tetratricopeptide (TPR) repeat protein
MQTLRIALVTALVAPVLVLGGCDLLDTTNVENPNVLQETALQNPDPLERWVTGLDRQMAVTLNQTIEFTSIATDNYENTETFFNQNADGLTFRVTDQDIDEMFFTMSDLRESAEFGKTTVVPADENPSEESLAELDFYEGMAHILLGEHFRRPPLDSASAPVSPDEHFDEAISLLQDAIDRGAGDQVAYRLAQARAYYNKGNLSEARSRAQEVLNMDSDFIRFVEYDNNAFDDDPLENGNNVMQNALYDRSTFDDFQPLPRLDFLDPKYGVAGDREDPIPYWKAEEAHFILIEAELAEGDLPGAQAEMRELLDLVRNERQPRPVDETEEQRRQDEQSPRPIGSDWEVRASESDPYRSGLVLDRVEETSVPGVSGTSVTEARVNNLSSMDQAWELFYLLRQQVFIAEGRRFMTFNLKLPLPENELLLNPGVSSGSDAVTPVVPSYIAGKNLDGFELTSPSNKRATCLVNMNEVLANNRSAVSPFLTP